MKGDGGLFRESRLDLFAAITGLLAIIWSDRISEEIAPWALPVTVLLGIVYLVGRVLVARRQRRLEQAAVDAEELQPRLLPLTPPVWHRPDPLFGRDAEVRQALISVREAGYAVIAGPRDVGTSAVAATVVARLVDDGGDPRDVRRFDLRSRSTSGPDDTIATAGRIVAAFGIDEPSEDTERVLSRSARRVVAALGERGILLLDNVSNPEQVAWLVREWPPGGARLVVAGETAVAKAAGDRAVELDALDRAHLRAIWDAELATPEAGVRSRLREWLGRRRDSADGVVELLDAGLGRPSAVKAFAQEIRRPGSTVTLDGLLAALHSTGPLDGPLERVWSAILNNIRAGLSAEASWLLHALAELPVTGLTRGAVAALLDAADLAPLEELRIRNLVREQGGRYRLPQEIRRAIVATTEPDRRREVALRRCPRWSATSPGTSRPGWSAWTPTATAPGRGSATPSRRCGRCSAGSTSSTTSYSPPCWASCA